MQITTVLPIERYDDPELAGFVEIWACIKRSSFQRLPSSRSLVRRYVVEVSRGISKDDLCNPPELGLKAF